MTREEAISIFMSADWGWLNEEEKDAFRMAISALSATHDSDIISRADAICEVLVNDGIDNIVDRIKELPSAEAVQGWIPFTRRPMTEEEQEDYPDCTFMFDCVLPDDGDEILVSNGRFVWMDTFCNDDGCYLDGGDDIDEDMAWMPLPKPYKGGDSE